MLIDVKDADRMNVGAKGVEWVRGEVRVTDVQRKERRNWKGKLVVKIFKA